MDAKTFYCRAVVANMPPQINEVLMSIHASNYIYVSLFIILLKGL